MEDKTRFDLSRALYGDPVQTLDGQKVVEIHSLHTSGLEYSVIAVIDGQAMTFTKKGEYIAGNISDNDLVMALKTEKRWVNIYYNVIPETVSGGDFHLSEDIALSRTLPNDANSKVYLKTIEVEIPI
jgi:hypothetical protein